MTVRTFSPFSPMPEAQGFENIDTPDMQTDTPVTLTFPNADNTANSVHGDVHALIHELQNTVDHSEEVSAEIAATERQAA